MRVTEQDPFRGSSKCTSSNPLPALGARPVSPATTRWAAILTFIEQTAARKGYPSSMREIGAGVHLRSTSSVAHQRMALEKKCVPYRDAHRPRACRVVRGRAADQFGTAPEAVQVPLVGRTAAGALILAEEVVEDVLPLPRHLVGAGELFALTDVGDIVAAMLDGEASACAARAARSGSCRTSAGYQPIPGDDAAILGKVFAVLRAL